MLIRILLFVVIVGIIFIPIYHLVKKIVASLDFMEIDQLEDKKKQNDLDKVKIDNQIDQAVDDLEKKKSRLQDIQNKKGDKE